MFEGRTINIIEPKGGLIAGQKKTYDLWTQGSIISITEEKDVKRIDKVLKEAKRLNIDAKGYLKYMIDEENLFEN